MKFRFKNQAYQTRAVESTVDVFKNQINANSISFRMDYGDRKDLLSDIDEGYRNNDVIITDEEILKNINDIQRQNDIPLSESLSKPQGFGACALDIEMETGTGKTYVYVKTIFELNKKYGWSKFIIVVPSIAIREGVKKSFEMLEDHFMQQYQKKAKYFIYNSSALRDLNEFSMSNDISVMIINTQAFAKSFKEDGKTKESLLIYSKRDDFNSRRPIDVISSNRPIIILDEPQKMSGKATIEGIKRFKPLFVLNYSATHKTKHNTVYALDPLDAFEQKLVKRIKVKGFEVNNLQASSGYLFLDEIILSPNEPPKARIDIEVGQASGVKRKIVTCRVNDDLFESSNHLNQYKGYVISNIDSNKVEFVNGITLVKGDVVGNIEESTIQRIQIRETIKSHFDKEQELFPQGIKTLSLFFIDKVENYKSYDEHGNEVKGVFQQIFEEEYNAYIKDHVNSFEKDYKEYLDRFNAQNTHSGYFSIDKKNHVVDSKIARSSDISDDISAYDLILKNKERLLDFNEPTRFIFSHSALREGWDNPNVFQICTLRHTKSDISKRQEIGRGLRLCVGQEGNRMDYEAIENRVHIVNELTVIANESYESFISSLQKESKESLRERPVKVEISLFEGKEVVCSDGSKHTITKVQANNIVSFLNMYEFIDDKGNVLDAYKESSEEEITEKMPVVFRLFAGSIHAIVKSVYDYSVSIEDFVSNGNKTKAPSNSINENNANKQEWLELWDSIKDKYTYLVSYDSNELISKAIAAIDNQLFIAKLSYTVTNVNQDTFDKFSKLETSTKQIKLDHVSDVKYDLVGDIAKGANLTRRTVVTILKGINPDKFAMFKINPEQFIKKVIDIIVEQKSTMIVAHITYRKQDNESPYDISIFTKEKHKVDFDKAIKTKKHITEYLFTDGIAQNSVENQFAQDMENAREVCVYAKLPRTFQIPTPVGNYSPDWAIAFNKGTYKHIYFVAETKGDISSMQLRQVEQCKIECAQVLFNKLNLCGDVKYHAVASYGDLIAKVSDKKL